MSDEEGLLVIAAGGDLILDVAQEEGGQRFSYRVDSKVLQQNSRYFENLLSQRFHEGQQLAKALEALRLSGHENIGDAPEDVLPHISIVNVGRVAVAKASSIRNLLADFLRAIHGLDLAVSNPPVPNLANLAVVADRFDAVACLSKYVQKKKFLQILDAKSRGKPSTAQTEERVRQKLFVGLLFDHPPWVMRYSKYLIIRDSVQWQPGTEEDHTKALWWDMPNGVEDELIQRREYILETINSLQSHFLKLYTSGERQCKLGYDTSVQCDSFQLGEMVRFFCKIDTVRLQGKIYDNTEPTYYLGDIDRLLSSLRQCSNYQSPFQQRNMFDKVKRAFSTRKSSTSSSDHSGAGQARNDALRAAPVGSKRAEYPNIAPFAPSSPTRRPSKSTLNLLPPVLDTNELQDNVAMNTSRPNNDAPPAYTPGPAENAGALQTTSITAPSDSDPYSFLRSFDTIFLIDDSGSMAGRSWRETQEALATITPICTAHDEDGIDLYFLNHPDSSLYKGITTPSTIIEIFQTVRPSGATPTGQRLHKILKPYLQRYEKDDKTKPINIIVITDGEPTDDVESTIIQTAKKLDKLDAPAWQVGIQFFQVGREPGAREHLKQLDDGLAELAQDEDLRDIVDTVPFSGAEGEQLTAKGILKVVMGAVHRKLDRNSKDLHRQA
ncbi:hypothetical protein yc1106_07600 [Curvularia clavata]|uniref:VWFA domain-containing protein n=1 Tax=Curvularia clavata TaxID=95742 RepID=A0A9Q8ZDV5_CURCL|nr:hypothetical protein yc1106_07600 [Curvularia clavata]